MQATGVAVVEIIITRLSLDIYRFSSPPPSSQERHLACIPFVFCWIRLRK